ncbi:MAG: (2Fe-2S)-binding protein [Chloroflexi bacterium]|nr:(2Fe-2S)-binding protein [Chloroflexota bacterium]MDA1174294.1 (2Fe-2S)-binding protein [Chloroflexota bacterium]
MNVNVTINDKAEQRDVEPSVTLLEFVRDVLGLKGTKEYCHSGVCGACTVLMDGNAISACSTLAVQADGHDLLTVEGLGTPDDMHPIQQAFVDNFGLQCGYCTPGMVLLTKSLLDENPQPTREEIIRYMGSNICRCTGYAGILASVEAVVAQRGK